MMARIELVSLFDHRQQLGAAHEMVALWLGPDRIVCPGRTFEEDPWPESSILKAVGQANFSLDSLLI